MTDADDTLNFDINDLTINEIVEIEEITGLPFDSMGDSEKPKGRMLQALAWITKRRSDPSFTFEQAGALKISLDNDDIDPIDGDE
jgi:hypothetical protein